MRFSRCRLLMGTRGCRLSLRDGPKTHFLAHRRTSPCGFFSLMRLGLCCRWCGRLDSCGLLGRIRLWRVFGRGGRWLRRNSIEVGDGACRLRHWNRPEFVGDRSGKTVFGSATPAASTTASTAPRPPFARSIIGTRLIRLFAGFVVVSFPFAFVGDFSIGRNACVRRESAILTRHSAFARLAAAATPPRASLAPGPVASGLGASFFATNGIFAESLGLVGFHFRFRLGVEPFLVVEGLFHLRGRGRSLSRDQFLCRL